MSTDTPETKNPYQIRRDALIRAIDVWQRQAEAADEAGNPEPTTADHASDLEDCLLDEGLTLMPRSTGHGKWRVLVDGQPAPYPGQDAPSHPMGAEEAAEAFLTATGDDYYQEKSIVIRPASDGEMVTSAVIGDTSVREEPTRITAENYHASREDATGRVELTISGKGGTVVIDLGDDGDEILAGLLDIGEDEVFDEDDDMSGGAA